MRTMRSKLVIFSDIDGTLLDHRTYSFELALGALSLLKSLRIPLVLTSSKTRAEIKELREELGNEDPFISENGCAIFIPLDYFADPFRYDRELNGYGVIELGAPHRKVREAIKSIARRAGARIRLFSEMPLEEIEKITGLEEAQVRLARQREYDEPFLLLDEKSGEIVREEIARIGLYHTEGSVFHHIMGGSDKGRAVEILTNLFLKEWGRVNTIGIGDSLNDLPMLLRVDIPVLVKKPQGEHDDRVVVDGLIKTEGIGPWGWNEALLRIIRDLGLTRRG